MLFIPLATLQLEFDTTSDKSTWGVAYFKL